MGQGLDDVQSGASTQPRRLVSQQAWCELQKVTLLWSDDNPIILRVAVRAVKASTQIGMVETATNADQGLCIARKLQPDVICMDLRLPDLHGLDLIALLKEVSPRTQVIVVSNHDEQVYQQAAIEAGAEAFIPKRTVLKDLDSVIAKIFD